MIGPNTGPVTDDSDPSDFLTNVRTATQGLDKDAHIMFDAIGASSETAGRSVDSFTKIFNAAGKEISNTSALTQEQTLRFSALTNAAIGASDQFKNTAVQVSSVSEGFQKLSDNLTKNKGLIGKMAGAAEGTQLAQSIGKVMSIFKDLGEGVLKGADNALALRNSYLSLAAASGELGKVNDESGDKMQNVNAVISNQAMLIANAAQATNTLPSSMNEYFIQIGKIPGALKSVVNAGANTNESLDMLTASVRLAHGASRDYKDIITDLSKAYANYNMTGEDALKFTSRFTEIANKQGVQIEAVRGQLTGISDAFKNVAINADAGSKIAEGAANIMNNYIASLKDVGLTGEKSAEIVGTMTKQVGNLNVAQKAFLSAQTGGPGGLMGAFQIEKTLMKEGGIEEVFDKVKTVLKKQFGSIVTLEDATKSEGAAQQLQKQILMLQQGPLGKYAETREQAMMLLEAFKKGGKSPIQPRLDQKGFQAVMARGRELDMQSTTAASQENIQLERAKILGDLGSLDLLQKSGLTAASGTMAVDSPEAKASRAAVRESAETGAVRNQALATRLKSQRGTPGIASEIPAATSQAIEDLRKTPDLLKKTGAAFVSGIASLMGIKQKTSQELITEKKQMEDQYKLAVAEAQGLGDTKSITDYKKAMALYEKKVDKQIREALISEQKAQGAKPTGQAPGAKTAAGAVAAGAAAVAKPAAAAAARVAGAAVPGVAAAVPAAAAARTAIPGLPSLAATQPVAGAAPPVAAAATRATAARAAVPVTGGQPPPPGGIITEGFPKSIEITGVVKGICVECGKSFESQAQAATNAGTGAQP